MWKKEEYVYFTQCICSFAVVILHTNRCFWNYSNDLRWASANVIESIFYFAVPVFFMLPGITLLNYRERYDEKEYIKKRVKKTVIPYLFWTIFGIIVHIVSGKLSLDKVDLGYIIRGIVSGDSVISVYWFFPALFCMYASIPFFAYIEEEKKEAVYKYVVVLGFVFNSCFPFLLNFSKLVDIDNDYSLFYWIAYGGTLYMLIGYLIEKCAMNRNDEIVLFFLALLGLLVHLFGTYYYSKNSGELNEVFKGYYNVPCILYSVGAFVALKKIGTIVMKREGINRVVKFVAKNTLGIYLVHEYIIKFSIRAFSIDENSIFYRTVGAFVIYNISLVIVYLSRKNKLLRVVFP